MTAPTPKPGPAPIGVVSGPRVPQTEVRIVTNSYYATTPLQLIIETRSRNAREALHDLDEAYNQARTQLVALAGTGIAHIGRS